MQNQIYPVCTSKMCFHSYYVAKKVQKILRLGQTHIYPFMYIKDAFSHSLYAYIKNVCEFLEDATASTLAPFRGLCASRSMACWRLLPIGTI